MSGERPGEMQIGERREAARIARRRSTWPRSRSGPRSGPSTCARSRTRSGTCCPAAPTRRASCAPTRQLLGLDGEALVDEYRRQVEAAGGSPRCTRSATGARAGAGDRRRRDGLAAAGSGARRAARARRSGSPLIVVARIAGGDDARAGPARAHRQAARPEDKAAAGKLEARRTARSTLALGSATRSRSAWSAAAGEALIDGQMLSAGRPRAASSGRASSCASRPDSSATSWR